MQFFDDSDITSHFERCSVVLFLATNRPMLNMLIFSRFSCKFHLRFVTRIQHGHWPVYLFNDGIVIRSTISHYSHDLGGRFWSRSHPRLNYKAKTYVYWYFDFFREKLCQQTFASICSGAGMKGKSVISE